MIEGLKAGDVVIPFHNKRARYIVSEVRGEVFDAYRRSVWRGEERTHWHTFKNDPALWRVERRCGR